MRVNMGEPNDLLLDDLELVLREIDEFNTAIGNNKSVDISQKLDNYLQFVAKSGNTVFPWPHVRTLFRTKMVNAIQQFQEPVCPSESFVLERFDLFRMAAPFTVQRLTELILQPTRHYRKKEKFLRGLEKTVLVVSTIEPRSLSSDDDKNGNEVNNTSASSFEGESDVTFNRTFPLERPEIVSSPVRSTIDVIGQSIAAVSASPDSIVLDPVTSSAVTTAVNLNQAITTVVTPGRLISEGVTSSVVSVADVLTPDIAIAVSSESIILDPDNDAGQVVDMETDEGTSTAMECESSTTVADVSPINILQTVSGPDLVSTALQQTTNEQEESNASNIIEGVSSSLVTMEVEKPSLESNNVDKDKGEQPSSLVMRTSSNSETPKVLTETEITEELPNESVEEESPDAGMNSGAIKVDDSSLATKDTESDLASEKVQDRDNDPELGPECQSKVVSSILPTEDPTLSTTSSETKSVASLHPGEATVVPVVTPEPEQKTDELVIEPEVKEQTLSQTESKECSESSVETANKDVNKTEQEG